MSYYLQFKRQFSSRGKVRTAGASLLLLMLLLAFVGTMRAQSLTVHDGSTTNGNVPVYGFYADAYNKCEMVYPAAELSEMAGGMINSLTFYASQSSVNWGANFQVFVAEVADATISAFAGPGTVVYEGQLSIVDGEMVVTFDTPYAYGGGNLLVGFYQTSTGNYITSSWYGESVTGASGSGYNYSGLDGCTFGQNNFLPKTTFEYILGGGQIVDVIIGDPTSTVTDSYLPTYSLYNYAFTQQIYTADEIGMSGTIKEFTMWLKNSSSYARNLNIYMKEVSEATFADGNSWVSMTDADLVATYTLNNGITDPVATTFTLNAPFNYSGDGNLVICFQDVTGSWGSGVASVIMTCDGSQAIYAYRDASLYDPTTPGVSGSLSAKKSVVSLNITTGGSQIVDVTIGDPTSFETNTYIPAYSLYEYALSQQIYTADEIGVAGTINTLTMWLKNSSSYARNINVYMKEIAETEFASNSDWVNMTADDMVVSFVMENGIAEPIEMVLDLSTPFNYSGNGNLVICFQDVTGSWGNGLAGIVMDANGYQAIYAYRDGTSYDVSNPGVSGTRITRKNVVRLSIITAGGGPVGPAGPTIVANPETLNLGWARPNGYWMEPYAFELVNTGTEGTITSVVSDNSYFTVDVEVPFTLAKNESLQATITTGSTEIGDVTAQLAVTYSGEGLDEPATSYLDVAAFAYDAVSPDVWELAEEVTEIPFQTTPDILNIYKNYTLPGPANFGADAVYKVTFENDMLLSAGNNGTNHVTAIYPEDFKGFGGPGANNNYVYNGPEVGPGPINMWFEYDYSGSNTWFGSSTGGGMMFGYRISAEQLQELGLGSCTLVSVYGAARNSDYATYYDFLIMKGGDTPDLDNMVYYQEYSEFVPGNYFDLNLDEPQILGDDENIWIMFYSDSPYAAYCGRNPIDAENGMLWYSLDFESWNSNTNYTPMIGAHFIELPTGREVTMNLADLSIRSNVKPATGELAESEGQVNGVTKAQRYNEMKARYSRGNRDLETILDEGFEGGVMPDGWTTTSTYWTVGSGSGHNNYTEAATGDYNATCYIGSYGPDDYLITPVMDLSNAIEASLSFNFLNTSWGGDINTLNVYYRVDEGEWNLLYTANNEITPWSSVNITLEGLAENYQIGFQCVSNYSYGTGIDDVIVLADMEAGDPNAPQYQVNNMFVPAGTYYVVTAATAVDFQVNIDAVEAPAPDPVIVIAPYDTEANVGFPYLAEWILGNYTEEMQVLYGTDYPPTTTLIDWTSELVESALLPELTHNRLYFLQINERNDTGTTEGEITSFFTPFDPVQNLALVTPYLYMGDPAELSWDAVEDEQFLGYNVYKNSVLLNDTLITETSYTVTDLDFSQYNSMVFKVVAVYENGQSMYNPTVTAYVTGMGLVEGTVFEQDGETPVQNVTININGFDEFGLDSNYSFTTGDDGTYTAHINNGIYEVYAELEGYQSKLYPEEIIVANDTISGIDIILDEVFAPVSEVLANYNPDENDWDSPYVKVEWNVGENPVAGDSTNGGTRSFNRYRVYRTAYDNNGPFSVHNTELLAELTSENSYIDETWENLEMGIYKYGVSRVYEGNRDTDMANFTETFDEGLPEGWTMIDADGDGRCWMLGSEAALGEGHGHNGSKDMMISKSFENGSSVCPDNYLVTPMVQFTGFSEFSFWACAQDANYAGEYFEVMVSTGSNNSIYDFSTVAGWMLSDMDNDRGPRNSRAQGNWYEFKVDLGGFAGQTGYIAIRHCYNCNNFYLDIDDVTLFDANAQVDRESEIVWSNNIGKDMYLTNGDVNVTVMLNSGDSPAGAMMTFTNWTEPEYGTDTIVFDETGYYAFDTFRKGEYELYISMEGYEGYWDYISIWEPTDLQYMIDEIMTAPTNLKVSTSGYVTWDLPEEGNRHFIDQYYFECPTDYGWWGQYITENEIQIPEHLLSDGGNYSVYVYKVYSSGWWSDPASKTFKYKSCDHFPGVDHLYARMVENGVTMTWNYPDLGQGAKGNREAWDLLHSFEATSGYQYGVVSDGQYIYTSSWTASSSSMFYKYDLDGNLIEEFDIDNCGQIRDMTYDGEYFYGVANSDAIYCLDLANHTVVSTIISAYGTMRGCTYDSQRDGFWVIGNWSGNLSLIDRTGVVQITGPAPTSASGLAYYKDADDVEHVYCFNNSTNEVDDYNIGTNTITNAVFNFSTNPSVTGTSGGCHVGVYGNKIAFFGDIQQSPQFIGIYELGENVVETHTLLGANIYYEAELIDYIEYDPEVQSYTFEGEEYNSWNAYGIQLLYEDHLHACYQDAYMLSEYEVYLTDDDYWALHITTNGNVWHQYEGGSVIGAGEFLELDTCTLIAVPEPGYEFYYWWNMNNNEYIYDTDTITFVVDANHQHFEANFKVHEQTTSFTSGWNWWTTYIEMDGHNGFEQLTTQLTENGDRINSQTAFTQNYGDYGWYGSLTSLNNESMFKVKMTEPGEVSILGRLADPADHPITLNQGWNWIGYVPMYSTDVNSAFSGFMPSDGDMVKSQYAYANYYDGYGWYGSLNTIDPGMGLMYKSVNDETVTFTYADAKGELRENLQGNHWTVNHHDYSYNMTMMAVVEMNGEELKSDQYELAAFVDGVCRGSIVLLYVEPIDRYVAFLTISGDGGEVLTFGLYDALTGEEYFESGTTQTFVPDAMVGGFENPFVVNFRNTTGINENGTGMRLFPNPVACGEMISINLDEKPIRVEILNVLGEIMVVENKLQEPFGINAPATAGIYTVRVITENKGVISRKIIVK